ncbi:serine/threonine-protein kinase HipA [Leucobacter exalbidus]|uniref:Serine/threonine-protein kinase HipA n=1 Tax=Leucobacter exalbidus TaxID=662960 RepID=A0A940T5B4_9MICO|nr:serine/threonine-protein kinase HipA [Leucobacter exalbidus]
MGELSGDARAFDFTPSKAGMAKFGVNSGVISVAMPLSPKQRRDFARRRQNWFEELLPEGNQYDYMLAQGGIRQGDTLAFLARYGRDVAGALQIWNPEDPTEPHTPSLRPVGLSEIRALLEDPIGAPLANDGLAGKSSLGGVQPKAVLVRTREGWAQGLGGYPTTHIVKPQLGGNRATVIFDEEYGARVARRLGLADFGVEIEYFDGLAALVIERFDRGEEGRVHQEDLSQALGAKGNQKYQTIGGVVSLRRVAETLDRYAAKEDLKRFARMVVLAVGLGNLDMHTKNIGLLHSAAGEVTLAPAYDVVPQAHLSLDGELALAVNRKYRHVDVTVQDLVTEISGWGLSNAEHLVNKFLADMQSALEAEEPMAGAFVDLKAQTLGFVANLRAGLTVAGK